MTPWRSAQACVEVFQNRRDLRRRLFQMQVVAAVDPVHGQVLEGINAGQHLGVFVHDTLIGEYQTGRRRDVLDE